MSAAATSCRRDKCISVAILNKLIHASARTHDQFGLRPSGRWKVWVVSHTCHIYNLRLTDTRTANRSAPACRHLVHHGAKPNAVLVKRSQELRGLSNARWFWFRLSPSDCFTAKSFQSSNTNPSSIPGQTPASLALEGGFRGIQDFPLANKPANVTAPSLIFLFSSFF